MTVHTNPAGYLFSATVAEGTGAAVDCRHCADYGYLWYVTSAQSAIFNVEASFNTTAWNIVSTYTAVSAVTATAQIVGYYPYVRGNISKLYSGTGGDSSATARVWLHWSPGLK